MKGRKVSLVGSLIVAALLPVVPVKAANAGPFTYVSGSKVVDGRNGSASLGLKCPSGTEATGVGGSVGAKGALSSLALVDGTDADDDPNDRARITARWPKRTKDVRLKGYLICIEGTDVVYNRVVQVVDPGQTVDLGTGCPADHSAIGGGGGFIDRSGRMFSSFVSLSGTWRVVAQNVTDIARTLELVTACYPDGVRPIQVVRAGPQIVDPDRVETLATTCPVDTNLSAGGADSGGELRASVPLDGDDADKVRDDRWSVKVFHPDATFQANPHVVCVGEPI